MFKLQKIVGGRQNVPEPEVHVAGAEITHGQALKLSGGKLVPCTGAEAPTYIAHGAGKDGDNVAVYAVAHDQVYEVACADDPSALNEGDKVTIGADALTVTATTEGGVATIISKNNAEQADDILVVKF